jgi:hypothetical protein
MSNLFQHKDSEAQSTQHKSDGRSGLSLLIRSGADALLVYQEADWFGSEESASEYEQLGRLVGKWGTPEFTKMDAEMMEQLVAEMISLRSGDLNNEYDGMGYGLADALLQALVQAAQDEFGNQ